MTLPQQIKSKKGVLNAVLEVDISTVQFDWFTTTRRLYNGSLIGPTLRARAGDTVTVKLV